MSGTWTTPATWAYEQVVTEADLNEQIRDNELFLKTHIALEAAGSLTISTGIVTATQGYHKIEVESGTSDDLDTITAGTGIAEGSVIIIRSKTIGHTIIVKNGTGNIKLQNDISLDTIYKHLILIYDGAYWNQFSLPPIGDGDIDAKFAGLVPGSLSESGQHGKIFSWQNTYGYSIIITQVFIEKITGSTAAAKINVGQSATEAESDNLIDGAALQGTGVLNLIKNSGTNGLGNVVVADDEWITGFEDNSADPDGLVGKYYIYYVEQA